VVVEEEEATPPPSDAARFPQKASSTNEKLPKKMVFPLLTEEKELKKQGENRFSPVASFSGERWSGAPNLQLLLLFFLLHLLLSQVHRRRWYHGGRCRRHGAATGATTGAIRKRMNGRKFFTCAPL